MVLTTTGFTHHGLLPPSPFSHEPPTQSGRHLPLVGQSAACQHCCCCHARVCTPPVACGPLGDFALLKDRHTVSCLLACMYCWQHTGLCKRSCSQHTCKLDALPPVLLASAGLLPLLELELSAPPPPEVPLLLWVEVLNQRDAGSSVVSCCRASWRRVWPPNCVEQRGCRHVT